MLRILLAIAVATATFSTAAAAQEADSPSSTRGAAGRRNLPVAGVLTRPDWISRPSGEDVGRYYPALAQVIEVGGVALLECAVTSEGALENCAVTSERPLGLGFGDASLRLAGLFKMKPQTLDGTPVGGGLVRIPIVFRLGKESSQPAASAAGSEPSKPALAAGAKVASRLSIIEVVMAQLKTQLEQGKATLAAPNGQADAEAQALALELAAGALLKIEEDARSQIAAILARRIPESDLLAMAAFLDTPGGRALMDIQGTSFIPQWLAAFQAASDRAGSATRTSFCAKIDCGTPETPTPAQGEGP